jgi:nitric oxide reductase NorQ protein
MNHVIGSINYLDWNGSIDILNRANQLKLFALIIGPKGTGKTSLVRKFAEDMEKNIFSVNFSLRTRESHLIGTKTIENGDIKFIEGVLIKSMREGGILYLDELNAAEPDMLLRLDEVLDERRQLILKEAEGQIIHAHNEWFVIATINPLSHVGTKELPPQLLSRFPVRIGMDYPPEDIELEIIKHHSQVNNDNIILIQRAIKLAKGLREAAAVEELYYGPSLRETIAFTKLINIGTDPKLSAEIVFANAYNQWGEVEFRKVMDMITSIFG